MNVILSLLLFILGTVAVLTVMALVAWVTGLLEEIVEPGPALTAAPAPAASAPSVNAGLSSKKMSACGSSPNASGLAVSTLTRRIEPGT